MFVFDRMISLAVDCELQPHESRLSEVWKWISGDTVSALVTIQRRSQLRTAPEISEEIILLNACALLP